MYKNKISVSQFFICMFLCNIFIILGFWSQSISVEAYTTNLFTAIISTVLMILVCVPSYLIKKKSGVNPVKVLNFTNNKFSAFIKAIYVLSYFIFSCAFLSKYIKFFKYQINREAFEFILILAIVLLCAFGCYKGINALFKMSTVIFVFFLITLIFIIVGLLDKIDFNNISLNIFQLDNQVYQGISISLLMILPLTTYVVFTDFIKGNQKLGIVSNAIGINVLYLIVTALIMLVFGSFANTLKFPSFVLSKVANITVIKGGDGMMFALITAITFILIYLFSVSGSKVIEADKSKLYPICYSLALLVVSTIAVYVAPIYSFVTNTLFLAILAITLLVVIPTFSYVIIKNNR